MQPIGDFQRSLSQHFSIDRFFPASHNWKQGAPNRKLSRAINMQINMNIPLISPLLAVEYFFICSSRQPGGRMPGDDPARSCRYRVAPVSDQRLARTLGKVSL
jgi:hypothetical protein